MSYINARKQPFMGMFWEHGASEEKTKDLNMLFIYILWRKKYVKSGPQFTAKNGKVRVRIAHPRIRIKKS